MATKLISEFKVETDLDKQLLLGVLIRDRFLSGKHLDATNVAHHPREDFVSPAASNELRVAPSQTAAMQDSVLEDLTIGSVVSAIPFEITSNQKAHHRQKQFKIRINQK